MALNPGLGNRGGSGNVSLNPGLGNRGGSGNVSLNPGLGNRGGVTRPAIGNRGVSGFADNINFYTGEAYNSASLLKINNALSDNPLLGINLPDKIVTPLRQRVQRMDDTSTLYSDMYDPNQVNSVLDVILKAIDPLENNGSFFKTAINGGADLMDQLLWKPLAHGDIWAFAMNNLVNLGETVDVLANTVKAIVPRSLTTAKRYDDEHAGTVGKRIQSAWGIGIQGRYQFDYDLNMTPGAGKFFSEMVLEVLSDPINWFTWGVGGLVKNAAMGAVDTMTDIATKAGVEVGQQFTKVAKVYAPSLAKAYYKNDANEFITQSVKLLREYVNKPGVALDGDVTRKFVAGVGALTKNADTAATHKLNMTIIDSLEAYKKAARLQEAATKVDRTILKIAGSPFFTPTVLLSKKGIKASRTYLSNTILKKSFTTDLSQNPAFTVTIDTIEESFAKAHKAADEFRLAGVEVPDDIFDEALQNITDNVNSAINSFREIYMNVGTLSLKEIDSKNIVGTANKMQRLIKQATNGKCTTIEDFTKLLTEQVDAVPGLKAMLPDVESTLYVLKQLDTIRTRVLAGQAYRDAVYSVRESFDAFSNIFGKADFRAKGARINSLASLKPWYSYLETGKKSFRYDYVSTRTDYKTGIEYFYTENMLRAARVPMDTIEDTLINSAYFKRIIPELANVGKTILNASELPHVRPTEEFLEYIRIIREFVDMSDNLVKGTNAFKFGKNRLVKLEQAIVNTYKALTALSDDFKIATQHLTDLNEHIAAVSKGFQEHLSFLNKVYAKYGIFKGVSADVALAKRREGLLNFFKKYTNYDTDDSLGILNEQGIAFTEEQKALLKKILEQDDITDAEASINALYTRLVNNVGIQKELLLEKHEVKAIQIERALESGDQDLIRIAQEPWTLKEIEETEGWVRTLKDALKIRTNLDDQLQAIRNDVIMHQKYIKRMQEIVQDLEDSFKVPGNYTAEWYTKYWQKQRSILKEQISNYYFAKRTGTGWFSIDDYRDDKIKRALLYPDDIPLEKLEQVYKDAATYLDLPDITDLFNQLRRIELNLKQAPTQVEALKKTNQAIISTIKNKSIPDMERKIADLKLKENELVQAIQVRADSLERHYSLNEQYITGLSNRLRHMKLELLELKQDPIPVEDLESIADFERGLAAIERRLNKLVQAIPVRADSLKEYYLVDIAYEQWFVRNWDKTYEDAIEELTKIETDLMEYLAPHLNRNYFLSSDVSDAVIKIIPGRAARTQDLLYGSSSSFLDRTINNPKSAVYRAFDAIKTRGAVTAEDPYLHELGRCNSDIKLYFDRIKAYKECDAFLEHALVETENPYVIYNAVMDALENMCNVSPAQLARKDYAGARDAFINVINDSLSYSTRTTKVSMDHFRSLCFVTDPTKLSERDQKVLSKIKAYFTELYNGDEAAATKAIQDFAKGGHEASKDVIDSEIIFKALLPDRAKQLEDMSLVQRIVTYDMETTGSSGYTSEILQLAYKNFNGSDAVQLQVKYYPDEFSMARVPSEEVLRKIIPDGDQLSMQELVEQFKAIYFSAQVGERVSEADILKQFYNVVNNSDRLLGVNISSFDNKFFMNRLKTITADPEELAIINKMYKMTEDIQCNIAASEGAVRLSPKHIAVIDEYCDVLVKKLEGFDSIRGIHPYTLTSTSREALYVLEKLAKDGMSSDLYEIYKSFYSDLIDIMSSSTKGKDVSVFAEALRALEKEGGGSMLIKDFVMEPLSEFDRKLYQYMGPLNDDLIRLERTWHRLYALDQGVEATEEWLSKNPVPDSFKKAWIESHNGRTPTSLYNVLRSPDDGPAIFGIKYLRKANMANDILDGINYKTGEFWEKFYRKFKRAHDAVDQGRIKYLRYVIGEGKRFKDVDALADALRYMQTHGPVDAWWHYIDVNKLTNPALMYAYWVQIAESPMWQRYLREAGLPASVDAYEAMITRSPALEEFWAKKDALGYRYIISDPDTNERIWTKGDDLDKVYGKFTHKTEHLNSLEEAVSTGRVSDLTLDQFTPQETLMYQLDQLSTADGVMRYMSDYKDYEISGGANNYAATAATNDLKKSVKWLFDREDCNEIIEAVEHSNAAISDEYITRTLRSFTDVQDGRLTEESKNALMSFLLFEAPIVRIAAALDDAAPANILVRHADELAEIGIGFRPSPIDASIIFYINTPLEKINIDYRWAPRDARGHIDPDAVFGKAVVNGKEYYPTPKNIHSIPALPRPEKYLEDKDVMTFFDVLDESRKMSMYFTKGSSEGLFYRPFTAGAYVKLLDKFDLDLPYDLTMTADYLENAGFFRMARVNKTSLMPVTIKSAESYGPAPRRYNLVTNLLSQFEFAARRTSDHMLYTDLYFNKHWGMHFDDNGIFGNVIKNYGDQADAMIAEAFVKSDGTFVVATLHRTDPSKPFKATLVPIESAEDVAKARAVNAVIIPYDVYSKSFDVLNNAEAAMSSFVNTSRKINYFYKMGYLITNMGTWLRNIGDSWLKTVVETGDLVGSTKYIWVARNTYKEYDDLLSRMFRENPNMALSETQFKRWFRISVHRDPKFFDKYTYIKSENDFLNVWGFFQDGPSAGEAAAIQKFRKHKNMLSERNFINVIIDKCMTPQAYTEKIVRLGQFLQMQQEHYTKLQIFKSINHAQFDYSIKSDAVRIIETVIPFFNFTKMNFEFWLDALMSNPSLVRTLDDMLGALHNGYGVDPKDADNENSLMYHMMHGNIMLDQESGLVLKLNPSYMDAFNLLLEPMNLATSIFAGMNRYNTWYGVQSYLNNSTLLGGLLAPLKNVLSETVEAATLEAKYTTVPFGKYKGMPMSELLKDPGYMQALMLSDFGPKLLEMYPDVGKQIMRNIDKTDRLMYFGKYIGEPIHKIMEEHPEYCQYMLTLPWFVEQHKDIVDIFVANGLNEFTTMPWGKYEGKPMEEVMKDKNYVAWLTKQPWLETNQPLVYNYVVKGQKQIIPNYQVIPETVMGYNNALGIFSYGATLDEMEAENHFNNIIKNVFTDTSSYPLLGAMAQRLFKPDLADNSQLSTREKNMQRLENKSKAAYIAGKWFPGVFGATIRYGEVRWTNSDAAIDPTQTFYTKDANAYLPRPSLVQPEKTTATRYTKPSRSRNYGRAGAYNKYKYNRGFRKYLGGSSDLLRLRLGIINLHLF